MLNARQAALFWTKVRILDDDKCWPWLGGFNEKGYGRFCDTYAHRVSYELCVGPIPPDLTIDHLCRNRGCANPNHLEVVTRGENVLRGETRSGINKRKARCDRGHLLAGANVRITIEGKRCCLPCRMFHRLNERLRAKGLPERPMTDATEYDFLKGRKRYHFLQDTKTHCPAGHAYEGYNLMLRNGVRQCRTCHNARRRKSA